MLTAQGVQVASYIMSLVSIVCTLSRLGIRTSQSRLGVDDAAVAFAMVLQLLQLVFTQIRYQPQNYTNPTMVAAYYMASEAFYGVVWFTRISILFTIIRLTVKRNERRILMGLAGLFGATLLILVFQEVVLCEKDTTWKHTPVPQCDLGEDVAVAQVITDVISDFILIFAPIRLVWNVRLSRAQKIRLIAIFCSAILTTIVSIVHVYYILHVGGADEIMAGIAEMSVTLIVANLSVLVAFFTRITTESNNQTNKVSSHSLSNSKPLVTFGSVPLSPRRSNFDPYASAQPIQIGVAVNMETFSEHQLKFGESASTADDDFLRKAP